MNKLFFVLIFAVLTACSAAPANSFKGVYSLDVTHKIVAKLPEATNFFTVPAEALFEYFHSSQPHSKITSAQKELKKCSDFFTEECQKLAQVKQAKKSIIVSATLAIADEEAKATLKLVLRKVDDSIFAAFSILTTGTIDKDLLNAIKNYCSASLPQLSLVQKHYGKMICGTTAIVLIGWRVHYNSPNQREKRRIDSINRNIQLTVIKEKDDQNTACSICFDDFEFESESKVVVKTACNHLIHKECLMKWLATKVTNKSYCNTTCPTCRAELLNPQTP